jgi:hypothetical protein
MEFLSPVDAKMTGKMVTYPFILSHLLVLSGFFIVLLCYGCHGCYLESCVVVACYLPLNLEKMKKKRSSEERFEGLKRVCPPHSPFYCV